jgi:hypothetical protein
MTFSEDQIAALAPDASSLKAGRDLAVPGKWQLKGYSDNALWGHCQGSGKLPYQTQIDLQNIAFKCSCPSRKFPCKHGLGLLFMYTRHKDLFTGGTEPDWVEDWLRKRTEKTEKKAEQKDKPVDAEAQAKRTEARNKKVADGVDDLQFWIKDLIRNGLLTVPESATTFWQNPAKRMVDAQASGLAALVKSLDTINYYNDSWKYELLSRLLKIYTVGEAFKHMAAIPDDLAAEVKTQIGFTQPKEEVLQQTGVTDTWLVLCRNYTDDEQLIIERNWLYGTTSGKYAMVLQFIAPNQVPEVNLMPGQYLQAELVFYKGANNYRALLKKQQPAAAVTIPQGLASLTEAYRAFSDVICVNPFHERVPVMLNRARFTKTEGYYISDSEGYATRVHCTDEMAWKILAITGGAPFTLSMLINEGGAEPLALWANEKFYAIASNAIKK